jgi:hypothetical protein
MLMLKVGSPAQCKMRDWDGPVAREVRDVQYMRARAKRNFATRQTGTARTQKAKQRAGGWGTVRARVGVGVQIHPAFYVFYHARCLLLSAASNRIV